jgi:hypothetical protein
MGGRFNAGPDIARPRIRGGPESMTFRRTSRKSSIGFFGNFRNEHRRNPADDGKAKGHHL